MILTRIISVTCLLLSAAIALAQTPTPVTRAQPPAVGSNPQSPALGTSTLLTLPASPTPPAIFVLPNGTSPQAIQPSQQTVQYPRVVIPASAQFPSQPLPFPPVDAASPAPSPATPLSPEPLAPGRPLPGPAALTLGDLEGIALANNPTFGQAAARVQAAKGQWVQVGLPPSPLIGYSAMEIGDEGRAGQQGGALEQEIVRGHKLKLNRAVAAQEVRQAEYECEAQRWRVLNDVRIQFYEVLIAQQQVELAQRLVDVGGQGVDVTQRLFAAGTVGRPDVLQARIEANTAQIGAENARNLHQAAWRKLAAILGMPQLSTNPIDGNVHGDLPNISWPDALHRLLSVSPELAIAQAGVDRARWALDRAHAEPIPNINLQLTGQHDNATGDAIAGVQAMFPLPIWNRNQGGIGRAEAELSSAKSEVLRVQLALQQRLATTYQRYANARQQVERYQKDILPDAQSSLDLVTAGYRQGEFNYLLQLTSQRTYFQTNVAYLESLRQLRTSTVEIEGLLLRGNLERGE